MRGIWIALALPMAAITLMPAGQSGWKTPWSYAGAAHWGELDPAYAACNGKQQSPVDIRRAQAADLPALRFEFKNGPLTIINNGYTAVRVNYAPGNGNFLVVGGKRYELTQFHFHHPSEEYVDGKPSAMAVHLMFAASGGEVAGVTVFLKAGRANATVARLWQYMPPTPGQEKRIAGVAVNPAGLLPPDTAYYTYMGSVTAPPCTEGVRWFVLQASVEVSAAQIAVFARLYPHDVRPVQPLNGRVVQASR